MAVNYDIQADVVDINADTPQASDVFLVDTNVWFWMTYSKSITVSNPYQTNVYPDYINKALDAGSLLYRCNLSFAELTHLIEDTEFKIYNSLNSLNFKKKEFRHNLPAERSNVVSEVQAAWGQIKTLAQPMDILVDESKTDASLQRLQTQKVDGYDLLILEAMAKHNVIQLITDDGDFATIPGIQVYTANRTVLQLARNAGKLKIR